MEVESVGVDLTAGADPAVPHLKEKRHAHAHM